VGEHHAPTKREAPLTSILVPASRRLLTLALVRESGKFPGIPHRFHGLDWFTEGAEILLDGFEGRSLAILDGNQLGSHVPVI
jgi:hypothetical protein